MPRATQCREDGCERLPLDMGVYCGKHIGASRQCKFTRVKDGRTQRCKKPARIGLDVCERHGGSFPSAKAQHQRAKALTKMERFSRHYEGDLDPVGIFETEFRRTIGRIQWLEDELGQIADEDDLTWGLTKRETISASETPGTNTTYEARLHPYEEMLRWERRHLMEMEKVWIAAKLDSARLDLMRSYVEAAYTTTLEAVSRLGLDIKDQSVRATIAAVFMEAGERRTVPALGSST